MTKKHTGPRVHRFEVGRCDDPRCGVHVLAFDSDGRCLSELVVGPGDIPDLCDYLFKFAYTTAVEEDG
jgi:hypothetical protein